MSSEIVNLFTSTENIKYLQNYLTKSIKDNNIRNLIIDSLIESVFDFPNYELLDNSKSARHSADKWDEVKKLNRLFIDDRLAFANTVKDIGLESYGMQMFIDDSLRPAGYEHLNNHEPSRFDYDSDSNESGRLFRHQDPHDKNRSSIPIWQIINRGPVNTTNIDELRESEVSQNRKIERTNVADNINTISDYKLRWKDDI